MRQTPLFEQHQACGGKVIDFHGWALPIQYTGIIEEHVHTRNKVSLFDCSHMGEFLIRGERSIAAFDRLVFSDIIGLRPGRCRYSAILNPQAGIVDDIIVLRLTESDLYVVTNATPLEGVARTIRAFVPRAQNLSDDTAKIDVQGPLSRDVLVRAGFAAVEPLRYYTCCRTEWRGEPILIARAGYTGELGYEMYIPNHLAGPLWETLLEFDEVQPAGLGARDTLRLEMGYTLYGQDVDESKTTLEAGMGRFIFWERGFIGRDALCVHREKHDYCVRTGIRSFTRQTPRQGQDVFHEHQVVGVVTSGSFGPSVGYGIGMAYVPAELTTPGTPLTVGPKRLAVETAAFPFYKHGTFRD
ncbi:MAG TPA: glycine cleavage system aminomethyltransferase GcvT [Candidatus Hydrogenedentes bacterium]|nr:glycine cleavage system aminomethyltransferase GcvT [Candidatus Hydrogenedentota bacterium]HPG69575.1 glycine cleavage system aminomethyltransferase GcvT [Candidatus Hydrogenedentota bacterium]